MPSDLKKALFLCLIIGVNICSNTHAREIQPTNNNIDDQKGRYATDLDEQEYEIIDEGGEQTDDSFDVYADDYAEQEYEIVDEGGEQTDDSYDVYADDNAEQEYEIVDEAAQQTDDSFDVYADDYAEQEYEVIDEGGADALPEIEVFGTQQEELPSFKIDLTRSSTIMNREEIERRQANTLMELVEGMAGITGTGGVRAGSQGFNIRGFVSNEDILKVVDGARQNFERYRYGNGLDVDPELLQQVEVIRGTSIKTAGTGTIGGAVIAKTKNARDLLRPGEKAGLRLKTSYWDNNNQKKVGATAYTQPVKFADALLNIIKNDSNNVTLADGTKLEDSENSQLSALAKISLFSLDYNIDIGYRYSNENIAEPFDAGAASNPALTITDLVRRKKITRSPTMNINWNPEPLWLNMDATIAYNDQLVQDADSALAAGGTDNVSYKILNLELKNRSEFNFGPIATKLDYGLQYSRERRNYIRVNQAGVGTFNESQPPGEKESQGIYLNTEFTISDFTLNTGIRHDKYSVSTGGITEQTLISQGRENLITSDFDDLLNYEAGLSFQPKQGPLTLFYNFGTAFRAPLIDELFSQGEGGGTIPSFSRCNRFNIFQETPPFPNAADFVLAVPPFFDTAGFNAAIAARQAIINSPFNRSNASCAGFYEPETSETHEVGFSVNWSNLLDINAELTSKLTYYQVRTTNLIESIFQNSVTGEVSQPGVERREGWEFEFNFDSDIWFSTLSFSILNGNVSFNYFDNNIDTRVRAINPSDRDPIELFDVPGDSLSFTIGKRAYDRQIEYGYRIQVNGPSRFSAFDPTNVPIPECRDTNVFSPIPTCNTIAEEAGYTLHNLFFTWQPSDAMRLGLTINNLTNKQFTIRGFAGSALRNAGRDVRVSLDYDF